MSCSPFAQKSPPMNYYVDDNRIEPCYFVNDIGVLSPHYTSINILTIIAKAYSCKGLLFRGIVSKNVHVLRQANIT